MKTLAKLVLIAAMFATAIAAQAQVSIYGSSTTIGDFTFHNYSTSDGGYISGTTTVIGDTAFTDLNAYGGCGYGSLDISGTSTAIGDFTFHNYYTSDGDTISGDSMTIGNTTFTDLSEW